MQNKHLLLFSMLCVVMLVCPLDISASNETYSLWSGTEETPTLSGTTTYLIENAAQLAWVAQHNDEENGFSGKLIELTVNVDLNGGAWNPIGTSTQPFLGGFNGKGHLVKGFGAITTAEQEVGLFGVVGTSGKIESLGISGGKVFARNKSAVGSIAGRCDGEINQCWNMAQVVAVNCEMVGSLVGELQSNGKIADAYNAGYITSNVQQKIGGLVGSNAGTLLRAYNIGYAKNGNALVGHDEAESSYVDCCFDRKLYDQTAGSSKEGITAYDNTKEMFAIFTDQPNIWSQSTIGYPVLRAFEATDAANLSVAPMYIDTECLAPVNHANDITENFMVSTANGISWECQADSAKQWIQFNGSNVTVARPCTERDALVDVTMGAETRVAFMHPRKLEDLNPGAFHWNDQEFFCYESEESLRDYITVDTAFYGWIYGEYHFMVTRDSVTMSGDTVRMDTIMPDIVGNNAFKEWLNNYKIDTRRVGTFVLRRWAHDEGCVPDWIACRKEPYSKEKGRMIYTIFPPFQHGEIESGLDTLILTTGSVTVNVGNVKAATGGGGPISYQWQLNGEELSGYTDLNLDSYVITEVGRYTFRRLEKDSAECSDSDDPFSEGTRIFEVLEKFDPGEVNKQDDLIFCTPEEAKDLFVEGSSASGGTGNYLYQWYTATSTDTTEISGATDKDLDLSNFSFVAGKDYIFVRKAEDNSSFTTLTRSREEQSVHIMATLLPGSIYNGVLDDYCAPYDASESTMVNVMVEETAAATGDENLEYRWIRVEDNQIIGNEATLNASFPLSELMGNTFTYKREVRNAGNDCEWYPSTGEATQYYGQDKLTEVIKTICKERLPYTLTKNDSSHVFNADGEQWLVKNNTKGQCSEDTLYILHTATMPIFTIDTVAHVCQETGVMTLYYEKTAGQSDRYRITYSDAMASVMGRKTETGMIDEEGIITITDMPAIGTGNNYLDLEIGYAGDATSEEDMCFSDPTRLRLDFSLGGYLHTKYDRVLFVDNNPENGLETGGEDKLKFVAYQWYKNDLLLEGETGQYYHEGGAQLIGTFFVILTDVHGQTYRSCEITLPTSAPVPAQRLTNIYPVPANAGEPLTIEGFGSAQILSLSGERVSQLTHVEGKATITTPGMAGIYYVQINAPDGTMEMHKLIVK